MPSLQSALPLSLLLAAAAAFSPSPAFVTVLNATEPDSTASLGNLTTADTVGCLDSAGQFTTTAADCALFYSGTAQQWLATDAGNCSWANSALDFNTDSAYGQLDHAFSCAPDLAAADSDVVYSLNGRNSTYICSGNLDCLQDAKTVPAADGTTALTWRFEWGSQQSDVPAGHLRAVFQWTAPAADGSLPVQWCA